MWSIPLGGHTPDTQFSLKLVESSRASKMHLSTFLAGALAAAFASAHPGHDPREEAAEREAALSQFTYRDLAHCADKIRERGLEARSVARRSALVQKLQKRSRLESE